MKHHRGFSLVELITVLILVGLLSATAVSRFLDSDGFEVLSGRDDLVAALSFAQQLAMARNSAIQVVTTASTIRVTEDGTPLLHGSVQYPLSLSSGVALSPATTLSYNRLGQTSARQFTVSKGGSSAVVNLSASGYAN